MIDITALIEMKAAYEQLSESDMRRSQRRLGAIQPRETALGVIHDESVRRVWVLADHHSAQMGHYLSQHSFAESEEAEKETVRHAMKHKAFEELSRDLFWLQAKCDIGGAAWDSPGGVGLREGWMLVALPKNSSPLASLLGTLKIQEE